jgi:hypothetical protein
MEKVMENGITCSLRQDKIKYSGIAFKIHGVVGSRFFYHCKCQMEEDISLM